MKAILFIILVILYLALAQSNYSFTGENNSPVNREYGKAGLPQIRLVPTAFADGFNSPRGGNPSTLPSPRTISNLIFGREAMGLRKCNKRLVTDILTFWGQFIDHDISSTPGTNPCDAFRIPIPKGDPFYDATNLGNQTMNFCRSSAFAGSGTNTSNPRTPSNGITSWLDASMVYGSNDATIKALRSFQGGKLRFSQGPDGPLMNLNNNGTGGTLVSMGGAGRVNATQLFIAGDGRANENPVLMSIHSLWVREHNRRADTLPKEWDDEKKFQTTRRWIIAHIQAITFNEYLATLLGQKVPAYTFNSTLNPQADVFFTTVAFRFGHDEVSGVLHRYDNKGLPYKDGPILLRDSFFYPPAVGQVGIGPYLRGAAVNQQNAVDAMLDDDIRNVLFNQVPALATDLAARNIQRARDHGVPDYNTCRKAYRLSACPNYACINPDPKIVDLLTQAYGPDGINNVDPFVGGLLEPKNDSNVGPLFATAITEQFVRMRNADRFWYQNKGVFTEQEIKEIEETTLSDIIKRNTDTPVLPKHIFVRQNISPAQALGGASSNKSDDMKWIIGIIIPSVVAAILIIVIIGMCFANSRKDSKVEDNRLYENLIDKK